MGTANLSDRMTLAIGQVRSVTAQWRGPLIAASIALFLIGTWLSVRNLGLEPSSLRLWPMVIQALLTPLTLIYAGTAMVLLARSAKISLTLRRGTALSSWATLAEALPVPGGAMVRAGVLMSGGTSVGRSSALVLASAVLWISLATLGCGGALLAHHLPGAWLIALTGAGGSAASLAWLSRIAGLGMASVTALHRVIGMALVAVRLHFAFLALGVLVPLTDTLPFALANIAGTAASIAPAGLGISESLAAAAAGTVKVAPGAAFLAVGMDRLICLAASAIFAFATARWRQDPA